MSDKLWMYCFQCRTDHYFERVTTQSWKCPNCEFIQKKPIKCACEYGPALGDGRIDSNFCQIHDGEKK
jgi:hypothetical protein